MKHLHTISRRPEKAATDISIGQILTVVGQIVSVLAAALVGKETA